MEDKEYISVLEREIEEQARLLGAGGTRELVLMAKVDKLVKDRAKALAAFERYMIVVRDCGVPEDTDSDSVLHYTKGISDVKA